MRRAHDHRLREHVVRSGARSLARHVPIPRSTISTWQRRGLRPVVTIEPLEQDRQHLLESIVKLDRRARVLAAVLRLLLVLLRVSGFGLAGRRPSSQRLGISREVRVWPQTAGCRVTCAWVSNSPLPNQRFPRDSQGAEVAYAGLWNVFARSRSNETSIGSPTISRSP